MEQQYPFAMAAHYNGHSLEDVSWLGGGRDEIFRRDIFGYQNGLHLEMDESRTFSVLLRRKKVGQSNKAAREIVANPWIILCQFWVGLCVWWMLVSARRRRRRRSPKGINSNTRNPKIMEIGRDIFIFRRTAINQRHYSWYLLLISENRKGMYKGSIRIRSSQLRLLAGCCQSSPLTMNNAGWISVFKTKEQLFGCFEGDQWRNVIVISLGRLNS